MTFCRTRCGANHPNFVDRGLQLSRSVRALKIWASIQTFGMAAFRRAIAKGMELAAKAEIFIQGCSILESLTPATLGIVCLRINSAESHLDEKSLEETTKKYCALVLGRPSLCILIPTTTWEDVRETLETIERFGRETLASAKDNRD